MYNLIGNKYLGLIFRLILGAIFLIASLDKISSPGDFASSIRNYRIMPLSSVNIMAIIMPWLEFFCGLFLIFGIFVRTSALLISYMLIVFLIAIGSAIFRGLDIDCGCFKNIAIAGKVGWRKFFEDVVMLLMGIQIFLFPNSLLSIEEFLGKTLSKQRQSD